MAKESSLFKGRAGALFSGLQIKHKIFLGFGVVVILVAIVAGTAMTGSRVTNNHVQSFAKMAEDAMGVGTLKQDFLAMRLHVREFVATGRDGEAGNARRLGAEIADGVEAMKSNVVVEDHRERLSAISGVLDAYRGNFTRVVSLQTQVQTLTSMQIDPAAQGLIDNLTVLQTELEASDSAEAASYVRVAREKAIQARLYGNMTLDRGRMDLADKTRQLLGDMEMPLQLVDYALPAESDMRTFYNDASSQYQVFKDSFDAAVDSYLSLRSLLDGPMRSASETLAWSFDTLVEEAVAEEKSIQAKLMDTLRTTDTVILVVGVGGLVIGIIFAVVLGLGLSRPITHMTAAMRELADGHLGVHIPAQGRKDELGDMAQAMQVFKSHAEERERLEAEQKEMAERAEAERRDLMTNMADDFEATVGRIIKSVTASAGDLTGTARQMTAAAEDATKRATVVSNASEEASSNVQTVAAASEELASSIQEIGRQVTQASEIAHQAVEEARRTDGMVQGLADSASKIGEVIALITDIAEQTNLLALNATIEAARAGDAGKGFAVVANEVKALANQTSRATDDIATQIRQVQGATDDAVKAIRNIGEIIGRIDEISSSIASAVEQQGAATQEITHNVHEASRGTQDVSDNIQGVTAAAEQTGRASNHVLEAAGGLSQQAEELNTEMHKFLTQIRAG